MSRSAVVFTAGWFALVGSGHRPELPAPPEISPLAAASQSLADSTNDGPHVYWRSDHSLAVFYLCQGEIQSRDFKVDGPVRFSGFCRDSAFDYLVPSRPPGVEPHDFTDVPRILAVSDVHGEYEVFVDLLQNAGVIDKNLHWRWDDGHLVIVGDVFDRGDKVTECLWLIYHLEQEARRAGGRVHFLLGNHELMVMRGDNRYVNDKYLEGIARQSRIRHEDLYGPDMQLGRWLRTKHVAVRLNGILFVHGGISPHVVERGFGVETINASVRANIDIRSSALAFSDTAKFLFGSLGPFWYRGYHYEMEGRYAMTTEEDVEAILDFVEADAIVVGHTEVGQVVGLHEGRVFAVDVPVAELESLQALLWEDGTFYRVTGAGDWEPIE
jgi:hypothetical protein